MKTVYRDRLRTSNVKNALSAVPDINTAKIACNYMVRNTVLPSKYFQLKKRTQQKRDCSLTVYKNVKYRNTYSEDKSFRENIKCRRVFKYHHNNQQMAASS